MNDEELLRTLLAEPENLPIIQALNDVLGGPIEEPNFATWRAVDADSIRRLGLVDGLVDSGLYLDTEDADWDALAKRLPQYAGCIQVPVTPPSLTLTERQP